MENSFIQQKLVYQIIKLLNAINSDIQLGHSAYLYTMFVKNKMKLNLWEENKGVSSTEWTECVSKSNAVQTILQWIYHNAWYLWVYYSIYAYVYVWDETEVLIIKQNPEMGIKQYFECINWNLCKHT